MSEADLYVFASTDPAIVGLKAQWTAAYKTWAESVEALAEELFPGQDRPPLIRNGWGDVSIAGFAILDSDGHVTPDGWRNIRGEFLYPSKRSKEGKALASRISAMVYKNPRRDLPGMPMEKWIPHPERMGASKILYPGIKVLGDVMYVSWAVDPSQEDEMGNPNVDLTVWTPVPLSQYYAAIEAAGDNV